MEYLIQILITANTECLTEKEHDYGIMCSTGDQNLYVKKIVIVWLATDTKQLLERMPSGRKQDWGDQPLFDQSDLYVIPEALIYEVFGGIISSTPSSSE